MSDEVLACKVLLNKYLQVFDEVFDQIEGLRHVSLINVDKQITATLEWMRAKRIVLIREVATLMETGK